MCCLVNFISVDHRPVINKTLVSQIMLKPLTEETKASKYIIDYPFDRHLYNISFIPIW